MTKWKLPFRVRHEIAKVLLEDNPDKGKEIVEWLIKKVQEMGIQEWFEELFERFNKYKAFYHETKAKYMKRIEEWDNKRKRKKK